jgi:hypothetical protein
VARYFDAADDVSRLLDRPLIAMERLKPLPQGFLAAAAAKHSHEIASPSKPAGVSSNPRSSVKKGPSPLSFSQRANSDAAIDSIPLPGQIVFSNRLSTGAPDALAMASSPNISTATVQESQPQVFWIKISATCLPEINGKDIDPVCIVSQAGRRLHTTEVVLNDSDPDFNVALKLDPAANRMKPLEFRIYDASNLELEDTLDGSCVMLSDDDVNTLVTGDKKGALLHESFVNIDTLATIIDNHSLDSASSLIYKRADQSRKSSIFLSLFPMEDDHLRVLDDDRKYLFELQDDRNTAAAVAASKHDPVLDVVPWHLCTVQNAACGVNIQKKAQEPAQAPQSYVLSLVLLANKYKNECLGFRSAADVQHAQMHPDFRYDSVARSRSCAPAAPSNTRFVQQPRQHHAKTQRSSPANARRLLSRVWFWRAPNLVWLLVWVAAQQS